MNKIEVNYQTLIKILEDHIPDVMQSDARNILYFNQILNISKLYAKYNIDWCDKYLYQTYSLNNIIFDEIEFYSEKKFTNFLMTCDFRISYCYYLNKPSYDLLLNICIYNNSEEYFSIQSKSKSNDCGTGSRIRISHITEYKTWDLQEDLYSWHERLIESTVTWQYIINLVNIILKNSDITFTDVEKYITPK